MTIKYILAGIVIIVVIAIYYFSKSDDVEMFNGKNLYSFQLPKGDFSIDFDIQTKEVFATILHHGIKTDNTSGMALNIKNGIIVLDVSPSYGPPDTYSNSKMVVGDDKLHKIKFERIRSVWKITVDGILYQFAQLGFTDYSSMYVGGVPTASKFFIGTLNNFILNDKPISLVKTLPS